MILDLRVIRLSRVWDAVHQMHLAVQTDAGCPGKHGQRRSIWEKASIGVGEWSDHTHSHLL